MVLSVFKNFLETGPGVGEIILRMGLTTAFVGIIGTKGIRHKIAGVTTHLMVAFAACMAILQDALYLRPRPSPQLALRASPNSGADILSFTARFLRARSSRLQAVSTADDGSDAVSGGDDRNLFRHRFLCLGIVLSRFR